MNRQAIAPVIAVTLLLITAVLSAVFFQTWFSNFQSGLLIDVESQSQANNFKIGIEELLGEKLFVNAGDGLNITKISIDGNDCIFTGFVTGVSGINVSDCIENLTTNTPSVIMVTNGGVISEKVYINNNVINNNLITYDCSPICSENLIYDSFNNLYWIRNLSIIGQRSWSLIANSTYSEPLWNETEGEYIWPNNLTENDYPAFMECLNLEIEGYNNWRLPTTSEWRDFIVEEVGGFLNQSGYENFGFFSYQYRFWTSTQSSSSSAAYRRLYTSTPSEYIKSSEVNYVTCVHTP